MDYSYKPKSRSLDDYEVEVVLPENWEYKQETLALRWANKLYKKIKGEERWNSIKSAMACTLE